MKKTIYILFTILSFTVAKGNVTDSIPNASFESWFFSTWYEWPASWETNNTQILAATVIRDTSPHSGGLAMMLVYEGALLPHAWCDFHLTSHPLNLGGYLKNQLFNNDSAVIAVRIFYNQQVVDSGYSVIYGGINPAYSPFLVPISQNSANADSCEISFTGGTIFNSVISVDDLQFDFTLGISHELYTDIILYPNPCNDYVILKLKNTVFRPLVAEVSDLTGRKNEISFDFEMTDSYIVKVNTTSLKAGVWILTIKNEKEERKMLLVKR